MYKRILVPLDGSKLSEAVLPHVEEIAKGLNCEIVLLHVVPLPVPVFDTPASPFDHNLLRDQENEAKRYLKEMCAKLELDEARVTYLVREGDVTQIILETAQDQQADLIAMSTHGRSGAMRWLLGSVTDRIVRHSPIPVLAIRPKG
jgi:nucleotide-binding universal stress UspA family protein